MKWIFLLSFLVYAECKKKTYSGLEEIAQNSKLSDEIALVQIVRKVIGNQFKEIHINPSQENNGLEVLVEFGGKTAFTFASKSNYEKELKLFTAYYAWKIFRYGSPRNLKVLTLSLIKPYHVYHSEIKKEIIEDVEVLRVKLLKDEIQKIPHYQDIDLNLDLKKLYSREEFLNALESIIKIWKVELDEFKKVELK